MGIDDYGAEGKRKLVDKLVFGGMLLLSILPAGSTALYSFSEPVKEERERIKERISLYSKVELKADTDNINGTDTKEWVKVYRLVGLTYIPGCSNPKEDLSIEQMKEYLNID
jgi:hypothetical protein